MLKFAILAATAGLVASILSDTAATIVLFAAAAVAIAGFWWKFAVPFAQLTLSLKTLPKDLEEAKRERATDRETLTEIKAQQDEIAEHVGAVEQTVEAVQRQAGRIEKGAEIAAERAEAAINVAEAVRRQLGVVARGDGEKDP